MSLVLVVIAALIPIQPASAITLDHFAFVQVAAGRTHSLGLKADGTVWAWGYNYSGQLGDGTTTSRSTPVLVADSVAGEPLKGVTAIAAGDNHSMAIVGGEVWAWGYNGAGQLGDGTTTNRSTPVLVAGGLPPGATAIAAGGHHSMAIVRGRVQAWGGNNYGQLGDGTTTSRSTPDVVFGTLGATAIAAGTYHSLAIVGGEVWAWGLNDFGQLGDGTTTNRSTPVDVIGSIAGTLVGATAIAAGDIHSLAIVNGFAWAWGHNGYGQLGDGTTTNRSTPVLIPGGSLRGPTAIAAGDYHSLAIADGTVWAWGGNYFGQLGDGTTTNRSTPVETSGFIAATPLVGATAIAAGYGHSLAIAGGMWAWGWNPYGQLGDGTTTDRSTPVQVSDASSYPSDDCSGAGSSGIFDGYAGDIYVRLRTAPDPNDSSSTWVCTAMDDGVHHLGGKVRVNEAVGLPDLQPGQGLACSASPQNIPVRSGTVAGEPYRLDITPSPGGAREVWICVQATTSVNYRIVVYIDGVEAPRFEPDLIQQHPTYPSPVSPGAASSYCQANGGTRLLNAAVNGSRVWLYVKQESTTKVSICARSEAASAGKKITVDGGAGLVSVYVTNLPQCTSEVIDDNGPPSFSIYTSPAGTLPVAACAKVAGNYVSLKVDPGGPVYVPTQTSD